MDSGVIITVHRSFSTVTDSGSDQTLTYDGYGRVEKKEVTRDGRTILTVEYAYRVRTAPMPPSGREVAKIGTSQPIFDGGRDETQAFSLPQSASLTAPSSDGAAHPCPFSHGFLGRSAEGLVHCPGGSSSQVQYPTVVMILRQPPSPP